MNLWSVGPSFKVRARGIEKGMLEKDAYTATNGLMNRPGLGAKGVYGALLRDVVELCVRG
jgi:hypothetical protein